MCKKYCALIFVLILSVLVYGYARAADVQPQATEPTVYLQSDLNHDGYVDLGDFQIFAGQWLSETDPNQL